MSGGGSSSGAVSYPAYVQLVHGLLLDDGGIDIPDNSVIDAINTAWNNSPFTASSAFNPDAELVIAFNAVTALNTLVDGLSYTGDYITAYNAALALIPEESSSIDLTEINDDIIAYDALLTDQLETQVLPVFRAGMLNIGAVNNSAFVIGEALLRAFKLRDVSKYGTELHTKLVTQQKEIEANHRIQRGNLVRIATTTMISALLKRSDLEREVTALTLEAKRIHIIAKKEQLAEEADFTEKDALWNLQLFQFAANLLASPSGGVGSTSRTPSKAASALAGALGGAAAGAAVGTALGGAGYGTAIGAAVGLGAALLQ